MSESIALVVGFVRFQESNACLPTLQSKDVEIIGSRGLQPASWKESKSTSVAEAQPPIERRCLEATQLSLSRLSVCILMMNNRLARINQLDGYIYVTRIITNNSQDRLSNYRYLVLG
jgi:hypothetical protein